MCDKLEPQYICMTCKTVIGPIWDDYDNQCKCKDVYEFEVWRVAPIDPLIDELKAWAISRKEAETRERPDVNIYKKTLITTWDQIIRKLEEIKNTTNHSTGQESAACEFNIIPERA